jgi:hypothetical protein
MMPTPADSLSRLFGSLMKAPVAMFVAGFEAFVKAMRDMQKLFDQSVDAFAGGAQPERGSRMIEAPIANATGVGCTENITAKEKIDMPDQDLIGEDLKLVRWAISFTKRDVEVALDSGLELVDYSTGVGDFKGSKKDSFLAKLRANHMPRPDKWVREDYPPKKYLDNNHVIDLPRDDVDKFMRVYVEVLERYDKAEPTYEKDEAKALKGIRSTLDNWTQNWPG